MLVNALNEIAALTLLRGADFLSVFDKRQLEAVAMLLSMCIATGTLSAGSWPLAFPLWGSCI
jgi:hypothetical protein